MLDDQNVRRSADDAARFAQDQLYQPRVLQHGVRQFQGLVTRCDCREVDLPAFGLGYHLLRKDQNIIGPQLQAGALERRHRETSEVIAAYDLRKVPQSDQLHFGCRTHRLRSGPTQPNAARNRGRTWSAYRFRKRAWSGPGA